MSGKVGEPESPARSAARSRRGLGFLLADPGGFRLVLATYDIARTRDRQIDALFRELAEENVAMTRLDLSQRLEETSLRRAFERHLETHQTPVGLRRAVHVTGVEAMLDYGVPEGGFALFEKANAERERLARIGAVSMVLWLDETASATFVRAAPDLWHWHYGSFTFVDVKATDPQAAVPEEAESQDERLFGVLWSPRIRHHRSASAQRLERLRQRLEEQLAGPSGTRARQVDRLIDLGWTYLDLGNADQAEVCFREAVDAGRNGEGEEWMSAILALDGWAVSQRERGDPDQAERFHFRAVELAREHGDRPLEARLLPELGADAYLARCPKRAAEAFRAARHLADELDELWLKAGALANLVTADLAEGRPEEARHRSVEALEAFRELDDRQGEAVVLANLGLVFSRLGRLDQSILHSARALAMHRELGELLAAGLVLANLVAFHGQVGQAARAKAVHAEVRALQHEVPAFGRLLAAPPVAIVIRPRDNAPMTKSRSQMAEAAWSLLEELMEREGLGPSDVEYRIGWKPGSFTAWTLDRSEVRMEEYFEVLEAIAKSAELRLPTSHRQLASHSAPEHVGTSPAPPGDSQVRQPGRAADPGDWGVMARFLDLVMTRAIRRIQEGKLSGDFLYHWFWDWWRKLRTLIPESTAARAERDAVN